MKPITVPNTFATQNGPIPLSQLDANFSTAYAAINDPSTYNNYLVDSGSANSIVASFAGGLTYTSYKAGDLISVKVAVTNTGATTINVNSIGSRNAINQGGSAMTAGQLVAAGVYDFVYDGTSFQLIGMDTGTSAVFTGNPTFKPSTSVSILSASGNPGLTIQGTTVAGTSFGTQVLAGTNSSDYCVLLRRGSTGATLFEVRGDGLVQMNEATLGTTGTVLNCASYESGTFTGTVTGMTATTTGTVNWVRTGNIVALSIAADITGTSNATSMTMTGLPAILSPVRIQKCTCSLADNTLNDVLGLAAISAGGTTVTLYKYNGTQFLTNGFTNSGTKGLNAGFLMTYSLQ